MSSRFVLVLVVLVVALFSVANAQSQLACGIVTVGGYSFDFSQVGTLSSGGYSLNPCAQSTACAPGVSACTSSGVVPLAYTNNAITWSFVDPSLPQLGVVASYAPVTNGPNVPRQLTVIYVCGPDNDFSGAVWGGVPQVSGSTQVRYTNTVTTSVICNGNGQR